MIFWGSNSNEILNLSNVLTYLYREEKTILWTYQVIKFTLMLRNMSNFFLLGNTLKSQ